MDAEYCGGCSNEVTRARALRRELRDGRIAYYCSEECRVVAESIEPPERWRTDRGALVGEHGCGAKTACTCGARRRRSRPAKRKPLRSRKAVRRSAARR